MKGIFFLLAACLWLTGTCAQATELGDRKDITNRALTAFQQGDYATLERMAEQYRNPKERTSSGLWKLTLFYGGLKTLTAMESPSEAEFRKLDQGVAQWRRAYPKSPSALILAAHLSAQRGWMHRGGGYASQVPDSAWPKFYRAIDKARRQLEEGQEFGRTDPHWFVDYVELLTYQEGRHDEEVMRAFEDGIGRHPGYYQLYFEVVNYLLPKWHGDAVALEKFADYAVSKSKASEGNGMYARIYWVAYQAQYDEHLFARSAVSWDKMKAGIDDVVRQYPDAWNLNHFAYFACVAGDLEKSRSLIAMFNAPPLMSVWRDPEVFRYCREAQSV